MSIDESTNAAIHGVAGALAGAFTTLILHPIDSIRVRIQALSLDAKEEKRINELLGTTVEVSVAEKDKIIKKKITFQTLLKFILKEEGILGLYKGISANILNTIVTQGIYFLCYEFFKQKFSKTTANQVLVWMKTAFCSGIITTLITNPLNVLQTRLILSKKKQSTSMLREVFELLKNDGVLELYRGLIPSLVLVIHPIIQYVVYEYLKKAMTQKGGHITFLQGAISKAICTFVTYPLQIAKTNLQAEGAESKYLIEVLSKIQRTKGFHGLYAGMSTKMWATVLSSAIMLLFYEKFVKIVRSFWLIYLR